MLTQPDFTTEAGLLLTTLLNILMLVAVPLASTINNPPEGYVPPAAENVSGDTAPAAKSVDINWRDMLKTPQFYSRWIMFAFASSAGLMIIGNITSIASTQASITDAAYLVGINAVFNCCGRFGGGILSDKIGGIKTLILAFIMRGINMTMFASFSSEFTDDERCCSCWCWLWHTSVILPITDCGFLRSEKLRSKLRRTIHRMGHQWLCSFHRSYHLIGIISVIS